MLNPDLLLYAYRTGLFPMADPDEDDQIYWYAPDPRAVMPLEAFHVPHNTAKRVRQQVFDVAVDEDFEATIRACAAPARGRMTTWISEEIIAAYCELHRLGYAHSVEVRQDGVLVGGLYGVALRGAFFGESMFHRARDA
ncbi:MAG: leucyl/phenylalanyl-tRNA--protein transferase, partial [Bacteroidota bacterium]